MAVEPIKLEELTFASAEHLAALRSLLSQPRETLPQITLGETRRAFAWAGERLGLEVVESESNVPIFLGLPRDDSPPQVTLFASWHAESAPVVPAALEGAERLALAGTLGALDALAGRLRAALVVAPAASHGSRTLRDLLARHRARLTGPSAFWLRLTAPRGRRRPIYLGARGRVILGVWGPEANPYRIRDELVRTLSDQAYGPRPLDFELLRKLSQSTEAADLLEEASGPGRKLGAAPGADPAERFRAALFDATAHVLAPQVRHPDRPQAWITLEIAENADPAEVRLRAESLARPSKVEMVEEFPWDRISIHHPSIQAQIAVAKSRSEGATIWPMAPWSTPSGLFTRALGVPLAEWGVPIPPDTALRFPGAAALEAMEREIAELLMRAGGTSQEHDVP